MEHEMKNELNFDKESWLAQKQADRKAAFDLIEVTADSIGRDENLFRTCLDVMAQFDRYSVGNILLIAAQNPQANRLAEFNAWKQNGISIKKGEKAILLLEPGKEFTNAEGKTAVNYNVKRVFDISQTDSRTPPEHKHFELRQLLTALVHTADCQAQVREELPDDSTAVYDPEKKMILLNHSQDVQVLFKDFSRELSMAYLDSGENFSRKDGAFIAMCSAYVLCRRYSMDTSDFSFRTLSDQCGEMDSKAIRHELKKIRDCANRIYGDMSHHLEKLQQSQTQGIR